MSAQAEPGVTMPGSGGSPVPPIPAGGVALPLVVAAIVLVLGIYWSTVESIVSIWSRSETFAHGFLIVPIVLVLIWQRRRTLATLTPSPDWLGLVLLACAGRSLARRLRRRGSGREAARAGRDDLGDGDRHPRDARWRARSCFPWAFWCWACRWARR